MPVSAVSAIAAAESAFRVLVARPAPLAFDGHGVEGLPDRHLDLLELREVLVAHRLSGEAEDVVWRRLVVQARTWGQAWVVVAAGMAVPGLTRITGRLVVGHRGLAQDIESEVVAGFLDALRHDDEQAPRVWLRLMWAAWRAGARARRMRDEADLPGDLPAGSRVPRAPYGHPDLLLGRAVATGVLTMEEADLIGQTRLGDVLMEVIADTRGVSPQVLRMRRTRAEKRLVAAVRAGVLSDAAVRPVRAARTIEPADRHRDRARSPRPRRAATSGPSRAGRRGSAPA
jgi:hypothetical protein